MEEREEVNSDKIDTDTNSHTLDKLKLLEC